MLTETEIKKGLKKVRLTYSTDKRVGFMRQRIGKNFKYYNCDGNKIKNPKIINRIKRLVIPPAWENVWICANQKGHLQATGYDEKGRKQYIYHTDWIKHCQENKFNKMVDFAKVLPKIRRRVRDDMSFRGMPRKKIIATVIWLLEHTFIRVGNDEYAKENDSFGLTTLRNRHVEVKGDLVKLEFVGKSGVSHSVDVSDPKIAKIIRSCIELPGYELFQYIDENGKRHAIDSQDVNNYLREITGEDFTAKDFRTWGGTLLGAVTLEKMGRSKDQNESKQKIAEAVKVVSTHLRNTPSVCRNYYIHPLVIKSYEENILFNSKNKQNGSNVGLSKYEQKLISLLKTQI